METNFNLFEGSLAPLKRYLSVSLTGQTQQQQQQQHDPDTTRGISNSTTRDNRLKDDMFGDWGIDDYNNLNSPTLVNDYTTSSEMDLSRADTTPLVDQHLFSDWGVSPTKASRHTTILRIPEGTQSRQSRQTLRDVFQLLMKKRDLMDEESSAFLGEFKYVLVTSQLLDETILVSRFYNKKKSSILNLQAIGKRGTATDLGRVVRLSSKYFISSSISQFNVIRVATILNHLHTNHHSYTQKQLQSSISLLLITLWLYIRSKNVRLSIIQTTLLNKLRLFIERYQKFDTMVQKLLNKFKEITLYLNIASIPAQDSVDKDALFEIINSTVFLSVQAVIKSLKDLLPHVNSAELENYCGIYNIDTSELVYLLNDPIPSQQESSQLLSQRIKRFQFLRRLLICTLLALSLERGDESEFMDKLCKVFDVTMCDSEPISLKWHNVKYVLEELQGTNTVLIQCMLNFVKVHSLALGTLPIQQDAQKDTAHHLPDPTLDSMKKLKRLQLELTTFKRNNTAEEQVSDFKNIGLLLESLNQTYQNDLTKLESCTTQRQFHLSKRISSRSSKRFSLPTIQHLQIITSPRSISSSSSNQSPVTGHKRKSSGLGLPLLTVLEDESTSAPSSSMPFNDYIAEHNLLSNDDTVVISSNTDDTSEGIMTPQELKERLESNFERFTSTSTTVDQLLLDQDEVSSEISKNDAKISNDDGLPLMDELRAALKRRE